MKKMTRSVSVNWPALLFGIAGIGALVSSLDGPWGLLKWGRLLGGVGFLFLGYFYLRVPPASRLGRAIRVNPFRRVWNGPMRLGLAVWGVTALLSLWVKGPVIEDLFTVGFVLLCVWVVGFLGTMANDRRLQRR